MAWSLRWVRSWGPVGCLETKVFSEALLNRWCLCGDLESFGTGSGCFRCWLHPQKPDVAQCQSVLNVFKEPGNAKKNLDRLMKRDQKQNSSKTFDEVRTPSF